MPKQTLLTGFGPFRDVLDNPSARLVRHFAAHGAPGHVLACRILPVSYAQAAPQMREIITEGGTDGQPFDVVLMLGVAAGSPHWRMECLGRNRDAALADADDFNPGNRVIHPAAGSSLPSTLPCERIAAAIAGAGLPVRVSDNAGGYLCNHLLFTTLRYLSRTAHPARAGFLHVPADESTFAPEIADKPVFSFEQHIEAVCAAMQVLRFIGS